MLSIATRSTTRATPRMMMVMNGMVMATTTRSTITLSHHHHRHYQQQHPLLMQSQIRSSQQQPQPQPRQQARRWFAKKGGGKKGGGGGKNNNKRKNDDDDDNESNDVETLMNFDELGDSMKSIARGFHDQIQQLSVSRISPEQIEGIMVDAYDAPTPLKAVANISSRGARTLVVTPRDDALTKKIEAALQDQQLVPSRNGGSLYINYPKPTQDMKDQLIKMLKQKGEACKQRIRTLRQDARNRIKKFPKSVSKDIIAQANAQADGISKAAIGAIDSEVKKREQEIQQE